MSMNSSSLDNWITGHWGEDSVSDEGDWRDVPCKIWTGGCNDHGYGQRSIGNGKKDYVHRLAWEEANGPIPEGMWVLHHCDNPPCYEIAHLFLGTQTENMRDMTEKGRHWEKRRDECIHGHEYTAKNTRMYRGARYCRECDRLRRQRYREARRQLYSTSEG